MAAGGAMLNSYKMGKDNIGARILEETEHHLWDDFVNSSPQGSIFTSIEWLLGTCSI